MAKLVYKYGMRARGVSLGAQPKEGFLDAETDPLDEYWNIIVYSRPLTKQEIEQYELDYLGARRKP